MITAAELTPASLVGTVRRHGVHEISMVPAMAALLSGIAPEEAAHTGTVERITMGTARCPPYWNAWPDSSLRPPSGSNTRAPSRASPGQAAPGTPGLPRMRWAVPTPAPGYGSPTTSATPAPGRTGRVELSPPQGIPQRHYEGDPEATAHTFRGSWVRMADIGHLDDEGCLHLVGRAQDFVNVSGRKVACADVERAVERHPGVREAAAFARPDAMLGEEVAVAVTAGRGGPRGDPPLRRRELRHTPPRRMSSCSTTCPGRETARYARNCSPPCWTAPAARRSAETVEERLARIVSGALGVPRVDHDRSLLELGATSSRCCASTSRSSKNWQQTSTSACSFSETPHPYRTRHRRGDGPPLMTMNTTTSITTEESVTAVDWAGN
ncbi:hypothetical protein ACFQ60_02110 [Streptomyces zhihengii]